MSRQRNQKPKTVLIAHRDLELVQKITKQCELMGMCVLTAGDTKSAVRKMDERRPDLLIIDHDLPAIKDRTFLDLWHIQDESMQIPSIILCQTDNLKTITRLPGILAYYCPTIPYRWENIEMFVDELVDLAPDTSDEAFVSQNFNTDHEE